MDIRSEWRRKPPVWGLEGSFTLADLVNDFLERRLDPDSPVNTDRDDVVDYCQAAASLEEAIDRACASLRPDGRMHNHQTRVAKRSRDMLAARLKGAGASDLQRLDFEGLLRLINGWALRGIGPVTTYDVATRIGAYLGVKPAVLHLHAGVLEGLRALNASCAFDDLPVVGVIRPEKLPKALRWMEPDLVEDFMCTYRSVLGEVTG